MTSPRLKRTLPAIFLVVALASCALTGCASFDSFAFNSGLTTPARQHTVTSTPEWIENLADATLEKALGKPFELVPEFAYEPGYYAATVPDYPMDIWERIRRGFSIETADNRRIEQQRRLFAGRREYFRTLAQRAEPYLYYILEQIDARDMPTEVVALAIVESAFRPFAYSHGRAAGVWQFIPSTGRIFGLDINYWYDGRRDIVASTEAALDYLEHLAESFDGDWLLAMAAYNAGQGNVRAALQNARAAGKEPNYWNLQLPDETMAYVPRIIAIRDIIEAPKKYNVSLTPITNEQRVRIVEADHQIDLALAAELADIPIDRLYQLNPGYNRWATAPEGPHRLVLPIEEADQLEQALAEMDPDALVEWRRHKVTAGETLSHIAHRYHVNIDIIKDLNGLRDDSLRAGEHLYVPVSGRSSNGYSLSAANRLRQLRHGLSPRQRKQTVTYTVRSGDSLARIAQRFNVRINELMGWNDIAEGSYLHPGQRLRIEVDVTRQGMNL